MNKKYTLIAAAAIMALVSCSKEQDIQNTEAKPASRTETLKIKTETPTKVDVDGSTGALSWTSGDQISVWTGTSATTTTTGYQTCEVVGGVVSVSLEEGEDRFNYAVYPANIKDAGNYGNSTLKVILPTSYNITGKGDEYSPIPMVAVNTAGEGDLTFYQLCGILRVAVKGLPIGTKYVTVSVGSNNIAGTFTVANPSTTTPSIAQSDATSSTLTYQVHATGTTAETHVTLNIPLPTGSYTAGDISVTALDASSNPLYAPITKAFTWTSISRKQGKKLAMNFPTFGGLFIAPGNLYTNSSSELLMADNPMDHYAVDSGNYTNDGISYSVANRTFFNWNELAYLMEGTVPTTYAQANTDHTGSVSATVTKAGYEWRLASSGAEWNTILKGSRLGSTVNGLTGCIRCRILVNLAGSKYTKTGNVTDNGDGTYSYAIDAGSDLITGLIVFPDGAVMTGATFINWDAADFTTNKLTYAELSAYLDKGCYFIPQSGLISYTDNGSGTYKNGYRYGGAGTSSYSWGNSSSDSKASNFYIIPSEINGTAISKHGAYALPAYLVR